MKQSPPTYQSYFFLSLSFLLLSFIFFMGHVRQNKEALATQLSSEILRFHILANSDEEEDQSIKLQVRSLILDYVQQSLAPDAGKEETIYYLNENKIRLEALANQYLKKEGFSYQATLEVVNSYFPVRTYDNLTFPSGYYDAARITLGSGNGHNWWCVLYPRLCFVDAVCTEIPEETTQILQAELKEGDYLALQDNRPLIQTRFFLLPMIQAPTKILD